MAKIGIIGSGSWGIALASLLHNNGHHVTVWSALESEIDSLKKTRKLKTLPDLILPDSMEFTADLEQAMDGRDMLVTAVPSVYVRETAAKMRSFCREGQIIVNVAKGIEESTLMTLSDILTEEIPQAEVAVLSGPSHAEGGQPGAAYDLCGRSVKKRDGGIHSECVYESRVPCLCKSGYSGN